MYAIPLQNVSSVGTVPNMASVALSFQVRPQQPPVARPLMQPLYVLPTAKAVPAACVPAANAIQSTACVPAANTVQSTACLPTVCLPAAMPVPVAAPVMRIAPAVHKPVEEDQGTEKKKERTISVKDPGMRHTVRCEVPLSRITTTQGLRDLLASENDDPDRPRCICRLWLEGRCGQGGRCRSLHVDCDFVMAEREKRKEDLADVFISEVAVQTADTVMCMGYNALARTQGLEAYRTLWKAVHSGSSPGPVPPARLCPHYEAGGNRRCAEGRFCSMLHLRKNDRDLLSEFRVRTPCCGKHGDSTVFNHVSASVKVLTRKNQREFVHDVPIASLAMTNGLQRHLGNSVAEHTDICVPHGTSRCKYGRRCGKLHVCREWFATLTSTSGSPLPDGNAERRTSEGSEWAPSSEWASADSIPQEDCQVPPPLIEDE